MQLKMANLPRRVATRAVHLNEHFFPFGIYWSTIDNKDIRVYVGSKIYDPISVNLVNW